mgnify:CR=1 FL=1
MTAAAETAAAAPNQTRPQYPAHPAPLPNAVQVLVKEVESASSTESVEEITFEKV